LGEKQRIEPLAPRDLAPEVPDDLNILCVDLLRRNPDERPTGQDVLRRLGSGPHEWQGTFPPRWSPRQAPSLIGRARHLQPLETAFQSMIRGQTAALSVHGRSGVGKTALVQHFLADLVARDTAVVLAGRCYEQESVPYKALDSLVDSLCR